MKTLFRASSNTANSIASLAAIVAASFCLLSCARAQKPVPIVKDLHGKVIPAELIEAYRGMSQAYYDKKPDDVIVYLASDYSTDDPWEGNDPRKVVTGTGIVADIKSQFPGNSKNLHSPAEGYCLRTVSAASNTITVDLLFSRLQSINPQGGETGNTDGEGRYTDIWILDAKSKTWKLKSRRLSAEDKASGGDSEKLPKSVQASRDSDWTSGRKDGRWIGAKAQDEKK